MGFSVNKLSSDRVVSLIHTHVYILLNSTGHFSLDDQCNNQGNNQDTSLNNQDNNQRTSLNNQNPQKAPGNNFIRIKAVP